MAGDFDMAKQSVYRLMGVYRIQQAIGNLGPGLLRIGDADTLGIQFANHYFQALFGHVTGGLPIMESVNPRKIFRLPGASIFWFRW